MRINRKKVQESNITTEIKMNFKRASFVLLAATLLPGMAFAQFTARFDTTLTFADANPTATATVDRVCTTGLPLDQTAELGNGESVEFIAEELDGAFTCTITASSVTNYTAVYSTGGPYSSTPCTYDEVDVEGAQGDLVCNIMMSPDQAVVTVSKDWIVTGTEGDEVLEHAYVEAFSPDAGVIDGAGPCVYKPGYCLGLPFHGSDPADQMFYVNTGYLGETISLSERGVDSAVETENDCGGSVMVYPGGAASCGFTNTVFFEGIPTLSQYGMAIMALLMLGVGFVGFRRFV